MTTVSWPPGVGDRPGQAGSRPVVGRAIRGRRLERRLEIGLDLGVVGGEDAMAGVGRVAVDGLAALGLGHPGLDM